MLNKLFETREKQSTEKEKNVLKVSKNDLLRILLKSNISLGKNVKIGLFPSVKDGLAIGLLGAKTKGSGVALSPGFTKQQIFKDKTGFSWGIMRNEQTARGDNAKIISLFSVIDSMQNASTYKDVSLFQLGAVGVALQKGDNAKQLGAVCAAEQQGDNVKQLGAVCAAAQQGDNVKQLGAVCAAAQEGDDAKQLGAVFYTKP